MQKAINYLKDVFLTKWKKRQENHLYTRHIKKFLDNKLRTKQTRLLVERIGLDLFNKLVKI